jgi:sugar phosphate isomerase/epimerase
MASMPEHPMRNFSTDHRWLSINTATVRAQWPLDRIITECAQRGIRAISPWRDQVAAVGLERVATLLRDTGIELSGYCRGGMFPAATAEGRTAALIDNRRAVDEAKTLNAPCLVLVVGGLPGALAGHAEHRDLARARADVHDGIAATLEYARSVGMPLAIEPLHPMYAADRACVNTMEQALDLCDALDPARSGALGVEGSERAALGVAVDVSHVCDWLTPTRDLLNDRGMMGDGVIDIPRIRSWVEAAGFAGYSEVEIFSAQDWWTRPGSEVLDTCIARHRSVV